MKILMGQQAPASTAAESVSEVVSALAAHREAELAVFPELYIGGYEPSRAVAEAVALGDPSIERLAAACREHETALVVGFAESLPGGETANSVLCLDRDGTLAGVYRKVQLFGEGEKRAFRPGDELVRVELAGVAAGVLICFDIEFPELARELARAGIDLLITASANMDPYGPEHEVAARARALENCVPHVYVNRVGSEAGFDFLGESRLIDSTGRVVAEMGGQAGYRIAELEVPAPPPSDDVDYLAMLPPKLPVRAA